MSDELREKVFDIVTDPPCRKCEFWDRDGHFCFLKDIHKTTGKCALLDQILALFAGWKSPEELKGWVQLAEDQSLPGCPRFNYFDIDACEWKYDLELLQTHCPLLKAGFLKVVKP